jgi:hypothetical protein
VCESKLNTHRIHVAWILNYWPCAVFKVHRGAPPGSPEVVSQN